MAEMPIGVTGHLPPLMEALRQTPVRVGRPEKGVRVGHPLLTSVGLDSPYPLLSEEQAGGMLTGREME
jgi:hypothetical protein